MLPEGHVAIGRLWRDGRWRQPVLLLLITAVASAVVISRRPDAFTNPQFYAEDGQIWFSTAYNLGPWHSLLLCYQGYFLIQPRLVAVIATAFPLSWAPLLYNTFGLAFQIAPVLLFMSDRFRPVVPSLWLRGAISAAYLLMPSTEMNVTITNSQWHLAILATLVVLAAAPRGWWGRAFDVFMVGLCALTGPFVFLILPVALFWWWLRRRRWTGVLSAVLAAGAIPQVYAVLTTPRLHYGLGATAQSFFQMVSDRVVLAGLFAEEGHTYVYVTGQPHGTTIAALVTLVCAGIGVFALLRAPWELRLFALVALAIAAAGLAEPLVSPSGHQWEVMAVGRFGERYFWMAQVAFVVTILWAMSQLPRRWLRASGWALVGAAFVSGLIVTWQYAPFVDYHWPQEARTISTAAPGTHLQLPINPGGGWEVDVIEK
jgi:hypothetical protein